MKHRILPFLLAALLLCAGCVESAPPAVPPATQPSAPLVIEAEPAPAEPPAALSVDEAVALLEAKLGKVDQQTGNAFSFGYVEPVTLDGMDYYRFRVSWLVDNDHLSYLTDYLVAVDGSKLFEYPMQTAQDAQSTLPAPYAAIISQYADAMQHGYYADVASESRDAAFGENVALEWRIAPQNAYYALADLDGNGVFELLIAAGADTSSLINYDVFCLKDETAIRPFDMDFGARTNFDVLPDGSIVVRWSNSAFESGADRYRLDGTRAVQTSSLYTTADPNAPDTLLYWQDGALIEQAAFEQALSASESTAGAPNAFDWISIAN